MSSSRLVCCAIYMMIGFLKTTCIDAHGQMNFPPSTRQGIKGLTWPGALSGEGAGGYCEQPNSENPNNSLNGACMLFSQPSTKQPSISIIPGEPTLNNAQYRTVNVNISSGSGDWSRKMPWRSPGTAPVLGSGCGVAGGGAVWNANGGWPATGMKQGDDPLDTLPAPPTEQMATWPRGSNQTVAFGVWANHGGGYAYRLCKNTAGKVTEECFQNTPLKFAEADTQWLQHINGSKYEIRMTKFVTAEGREWVRIPFPTCNSNHGFTDGKKGADGIYFCPNGTEFPEPLLNGERVGLVGFGYCNHTANAGRSHDDNCTADKYHDFSTVDKVVVPETLDTGNYLLSWRWDAEQTTQIWQNCADVVITA